MNQNVLDVVATSCLTTSSATLALIKNKALIKIE